MVASAGQRLLREDALGALRDLIKRVDVITPNLPEAAALLGVPAARDEAEMRAQGEKLLALGAGAVLIKGGHGSGADSVDLLIDADGTRGSRRRASRRATRTAPAARWHRRSPPVSPKGCRSWTRPERPRPMSPPPSPRRTGSRSGSGRGPLHHFHAWW